MQMTSRLGPQLTCSEGTFDCPELVLKQIKEDIKSLKRAFPHITIERVGTHVHDRGHVLAEYNVSSTKKMDSAIDDIAEYLDSLAHHLYADLRGFDASRWVITPYPF